MTAKVNCWEFKKCGREPGGARAADFGICPAASANISGLNCGSHAGRICWAVAGTLCGGKIQGTFAQKVANCVVCEFYLAVKQEEGASFKLVSGN